jgi:bacterioferritin
MHPLAVSPEEGLFAVPQQAMISLLQKALKLKYTAVLAYINYGDRIRAHYRDTIYAHFQEHLDEERKACYDLAMKITALGGEPDVQVQKVPSTPALAEMFMHLMRLEKELIEGQRAILAAAGENVGLRILIENSLLEDQRHLDDIRRMMVPVL